MQSHKLLKITSHADQWEKEQQQKQSLEYQRRQTISAEKALEEAKKANKISERAVEKSNSALIVSIVFGTISTILAIISLIVSACK